ncbi:unnamed protein product [Clonostachys solani]|uniref:Uncharacterized protein n=1 Tax=Clonostachys solani TaxID=160281 RepID=A0A9N9YT38_9HYPO|nr:unnamed protein product [Clonostachys solani]
MADGDSVQHRLGPSSTVTDMAAGSHEDKTEAWSPEAFHGIASSQEARDTQPSNSSARALSLI